MRKAPERWAVGGPTSFTHRGSSHVWRLSAWCFCPGPVENVVLGIITCKWGMETIACVRSSCCEEIHTHSPTPSGAQLSTVNVVDVHACRERVILGCVLLAYPKGFRRTAFKTNSFSARGPQEAGLGDVLHSWQSASPESLSQAYCFYSCLTFNL